jgi:serine/threonine protein kinase
VDRTSFFDRLRQSRLLSEAELEQAASRFGDTEPAQSIADALVDQGVLTAFQARQVYSGDTQPLALGQYRLRDELGRGGMGRVYKALHTIMGRVVAIKVIAPELVQNSVAVEWFRREVRASTHLVHPNIVMAYDANEADGLHFLVMEYVPGVNLDRLVRQHGPLPVDHACALMRQSALGLQNAHEKGMVHRDIKPGNLLIPSPDGEAPADVLVKIADFGLARLQGKAKGDTIAVSAPGNVLGTPDYIAPEQSRDIHSADIRSDLYSLGCTFYFALAGRVPFPGENAMEKLIKHMMEPAEALEKVRPDVPPALADLVRRLMAKKPDDRYQTPAELVRALDLLQAESSPAPSHAPLTTCRPIWIAPPTQVPAVGAAPSDLAAPTRVLDHLELAGSPADDEISEQIVLEPVWKHAPGEARSEETHDTVTLSRADDAEPTFAGTTPPEPNVAGRPIASESMLPAVSVPALEPASGQRIDGILRRHWHRWTGLIETVVRGHGPARVNADTYRTVYTSLVNTCRSAAEAAPTPQRRAYFQELLSIVQPWFNLHTFIHTETQMLQALLVRCKQAELELNDGNVPWTVRQVVGMVLLMLSPVGLALWYWNSARRWLPALWRSFEWDGPKPSLRSAWSYIETHPSLLMGVMFPAVIAFSIYLLARTPRT